MSPSPSTNPSTRRLREAREFSALAHPLRQSIIELLTVNGPMTATQLAGELDQTPANCSWHLRKLAELDFVEEAERGTGRQRPWRVSNVGFTVSEADLGPESLAAAQQLESLWLQRALDRYHAARVAGLGEPAWGPAMSCVEDVAWLTTAELAEINQTVRQAVAKHRDRLHDPASRPEGARLCEFVAWGVPVDLDSTDDAR